MTDIRWYAALTVANREADAAYKLKRQGYSVFLPRRWVTWSHRGKTTSELRPLLSRYLFCAVSSGQSVGAINDTDGISRVLTMAGEAFELPADVMWQLRRGFDPAGIEQPPPRTARHLRKMLRGIPGEIQAELLASMERLDDSGRVRYQRQLRSARLVPDLVPLLQRRTAKISRFQTDRGAAA